MTQRTLTPGAGGEEPMTPAAGNGEGDAQPEPFGPEPVEAPVMTGNLHDLIQAYIGCDRRIKELEVRLKEEKALKQKMQTPLLDQFAVNRIQNQKMETGETVFIHKNTQVSLRKNDAGELADAHQALRDHGLDYLVRDNVNGNQLSAWYREQMENEEEIPEELSPFLNVSNIFQVRVRH